MSRNAISFCGPNIFSARDHLSCSHRPAKRSLSIAHSSRNILTIHTNPHETNMLDARMPRLLEPMRRPDEREKDLTIVRGRNSFGNGFDLS